MTVKVVIIKKSRFSGVPIIIQFFCIVQVNLVLRVVNANLRAKVYKSCKAKTTFSLSSDYHRVYLVIKLISITLTALACA